MDLAESKIREPSYWQPGASSVERAPNSLEIFHNRPKIMLSPHWHAQVEVNFIMRGTVHYKMAEHEVSLSEGDMCLFWGGLPHQMDDAQRRRHLCRRRICRWCISSGCICQATYRSRLMTGATLVTSATDASDHHNFERWNQYWRSGDAAKTQHAVNELLLRLERVRFEPYRLVPEAAASEDVASPFDQQSSRNVWRMCDFIARNFRDEIDCVDIAAAADIHPKYAMSVFRKSTGMTLNEYVNLLRLSYAQALLMKEDANVISVAMDSGFGSLSAFNRSFRKLAGMSPSDFRKVSATR